MPSFISWFIFMLAAATAAGQPCAEGHIPGGHPPFGCRPRKVDAAAGGSVIAPCADTIRLCLGKPLPVKHPESPVSSPVRLYRMGPDPTVPTVVQEVGVHWASDADNGSVVAIPDPPLEALEADQRTPVRYRLVTDCRFWEGPLAAQPDTSFVEIWKQHVVHYAGQARRIHDQLQIDADVVMSPASQISIAYIAEGVYLSAESGERYMFDHWTCSDPVVPLIEDAAEQHLLDVCWPLEDTVVFTAWYRDRTADLRYQALEAFRIHATRYAVSVADPRDVPFTELVITDLHGRTMLMLSNPGRSADYHAAWSATPGLYSATIRTAHAVQIIPLIVSP